MQLQPMVNILLSTFNGALYLTSQLDSLLAQTYRNIIITIRDDGSDDHTLALAEHYAERHPQIKVIPGPNLGIIKSYFHLLQIAEPEAHFFAFCDQDDVWLPDKISAAVEKLAELDMSKPLLYCSAVEYVDSNLNHLGFSNEIKEFSFRTALAENVVTGCTAVINQAARELVLSSLPRFALIHDWWLYLVVSAFGEMAYDNRTYIKYRQHDANFIGGEPGFIRHFVRRLKRFLGPTNHEFTITKQAAEFLRCFGPHLKVRDREVLLSLLASKKNYLSRCQYALNPGVKRQSAFDQALFRCLIMLNRY